MGLQSVSKALQDGHRLRGFCEERAIRVAVLEDLAGQQRGCARHITVEDALVALGRSYEEEGKVRVSHYTTGSIHPVSQLDELIFRGHILQSYWDGALFICNLYGPRHVRPPHDVVEKVQSTGKPADWEFRGIHYLVHRDRFGCVVLEPKNAKTNHDPLIFWSMRTGSGASLTDAIAQALEVEPVVVE